MEERRWSGSWDTGWNRCLLTGGGLDCAAMALSQRYASGCEAIGAQAHLVDLARRVVTPSVMDENRLSLHNYVGS